MHTKCKQKHISSQHLNLGHPSLSTYGKGRTGQIYLAVAPWCNISCNYCVRKFDYARESDPGVSNRVETPDQALQTVKRIVASAQGEKFTVVGITGPGEPLANNATFETLRMVKKHFPRMILCLKTNGLLLPEKLEELTDIGVSHITVTINTLDELVGTRIYSYIRWKGKTLFGPEASWILIDKQLAGLELAAKAGMTLKVNTVLIPGVNDNLLYDLCLEIKKRGAHIHNILPLIPQGKLSHIKAPTKDLITSIRSYIGEMLPQI